MFVSRDRLLLGPQLLTLSSIVFVSSFVEHDENDKLDELDDNALEFDDVKSITGTDQGAVEND